MQKAIISGHRQEKLIEVPDLRAKEDVGCGPKSMPPQCVPNITPLSMVTKPGKVEIGDRVVIMPQSPCGRCSLCIADDYIHCYNFRFSGFAHGNSTMALYILKPSWMLPKIPADVSYDWVSSACCALGSSFSAFEKKVDSFSTVLITGVGPVGLGAITNV